MLADHLLKANKKIKNLKKHDKEFNITKNSKYDGYQRGLSSMVYKFLDKYEWCC